MNKLIQEFAEKCTVSCIDGRGVELNEIDVEKFAQTIIKECIEQIHGADVGDLKAKSYYLDKVAEHIEKHFGIE